jgi:YD repeat-containing protein
MHKIYCLLLITESFTLLAQNHTTHADYLLPASVKAITINHYDANADGTARSILSTQFLKFDAQGNILEDQECAIDSSACDHTLFVYNEKGSILEETQRDLANDQLFRTTYIYNANNNLIEEIFSGETRVYTKTISHYNKKNQLIRESLYDQGGVDTTCSQIFTYVYDSEGNMIEKTNIKAKRSDIKETFEYTKEGLLTVHKTYSGENLSSHYEYVYDKAGNRIEVISFYEDGTRESNITYKYDKQRNMLEECVYMADGTVNVKYVFTYDENGKVTQQTNYDNSGNQVYNTTLTYDSNQQLIEQITTDINGVQKETYTYEYDSQNNWISCTLFISAKPEHIIVRVIEYHP